MQYRLDIKAIAFAFDSCWQHQIAGTGDRMPKRYAIRHTVQEENLMALCSSCYSTITAQEGDRWK